MQTLVNRFISIYLRARYVIKKSGATEENFMADAHMFYLYKYKKPFIFVEEFFFLKTKKKYMLDTAQVARNDVLAADGTRKKGKGGSGSRKVTRSRVVDSDEEDLGDNVPRQKLSRRIAKETGENDIAHAKNLAEIDLEREKFTQKAELHRQSIQVDSDRVAVDRQVSETTQWNSDKEVMLLIIIYRFHGCVLFCLTV